MKTVLLSMMLVAGLAIDMFAQGSNLIFFTPEGEQFYVIINGIRQNEEPQTNVKVTGLNGSAKVKIIFADTELGEVDKNFFLDPVAPYEATCQIKYIEKKGEYAIKFFGQVPIAQAPPTPPNTRVVAVNTTPMPPISTTTTTTTTTTGGPGVTDRVSMNVGMMGVGMNVDVSVSDNISTTSSTTTTTTTTTGGVAPAPAQADHYVMPGYNGPIGCPWPMSPVDFGSAKESIRTKTFEDSKLTIARQIFGSNCLTSGQVREIMNLFTYEDSKLEFAKFAYGHTFDLGNYFKVNDAFTYETSIDELNEFINGGGGW